MTESQSQDCISETPDCMSAAGFDLMNHIFNYFFQICDAII